MCGLSPGGCCGAQPRVSRGSSGKAGKAGKAGHKAGTWFGAGRGSTRSTIQTLEDRFSRARHRIPPMTRSIHRVVVVPKQEARMLWRRRNAQSKSSVRRQMTDAHCWDGSTSSRCWSVVPDARLPHVIPVRNRMRTDHASGSSALRAAANDRHLLSIGGTMR